MPYFQWDRSLSVGEAALDSDHKSLIELSNELHGAANANQDTDILEEILQRLLIYTSEHFAREEQMMEEYQFLELASHKKQHRKLIERVLTLQKALAENRAYVAQETAELLRFWLTSHIHVADKALAKAIQSSHEVSNKS